MREATSEQAHLLSQPGAKQTESVLMSLVVCSLQAAIYVYLLLFLC